MISIDNQIHILNSHLFWLEENSKIQQENLEEVPFSIRGYHYYRGIPLLPGDTTITGGY